MTIFYVYLNGTCILGGCTVSGRVLLTCQSRYAADEFFRKLHTAKYTNGTQLFPSIARATPQFWYFDCADGYPDPSNYITSVLSGRTFVTEFKTQIMIKTLGSDNNRTLEWPIIPVVDGPDWLHNGTYCIRSKRRPDRYWSCDSSLVFITDSRSYRFRICRVNFTIGDSDVLVRSDRIHIIPLHYSNGETMYVGTVDEKSSAVGDTRLIVRAKPVDWAFGELLGGFRESPPGLVPNIKWTGSNDGDDWELS